MSVFTELADNQANITDRSSVGSLTLKSERSGKQSKQPKSLIKCHRSVDPALKIRPFRSKVTFSEDTKAGDNSISPPVDYSRPNVFAKYDSSSESVASVIRTFEERHKRKPRLSGSSLRVTSEDSQAFSELIKRRQSLDPNLYLNSKKEEEVTEDNWLHYQSLPNIQEEEHPASPTDTVFSSEQLPTGHFEVSNVPRALAGTTALLLPQATQPFCAPRRRSIKRQKSQEVFDDEAKSERIPMPALVKKQSSDDSQTSDNSTNSNQLRGSGQFLPASILRRRKEDLKPRQASTESDTGSYHTVNSFLMQIEKSNSSSIDSFTSATSETNNKEKSDGEQHCGGSRLKSAMFLESPLVPSITFSQSTPSVTSQSSDDQSSPKWDQGEFSSMETVREVPYSIRGPAKDFGPIPTVRVAPPTPTTIQAAVYDSLHLNIHDPEETTNGGGSQTKPNQPR